VAAILYSLCALIALFCAVMLLRSFKRTGYELLRWSSYCFFGFTVNNVLLFMDRVVFPDVDMHLWRLLTALISVGLLVYGLVFKSE
jgi:hypothetical protein